jgi:hypothetical protein
LGEESLRLSKLSVGCDAGTSSLGDKGEQVLIGSDLLLRHLKTDLCATNLHIRVRCLGNYGNADPESFCLGCLGFVACSFSASLKSTEQINFP